jgi:hypothetical protein
MSAIVEETRSPLIEAVRGRLSSTCADDLLAFWAERGALPEEEARRRLDQVACVLRDDDVVVGVSSVHAAEVPLIGGRRFWVYRSLLAESVGSHAPEIMRATFHALDSEFDGEAGSPVGLCALVAAAQRRHLPPEADWRLGAPVAPAQRHHLSPEGNWLDARMLYAGYLEDGRQVRVAYFTGANIVPAATMPYRDWQVGAGYRIEAFAEQDLVRTDDVIALWLREGVLSYEQALRRVGEVIAVATDTEGRLAGVSTAYLQRSDQLQADLWYLRGFVASAHRRSSIVVALAVAGRDRLARRFVTGEDRRGIGIIFEVESELLKRAYPVAVWPWTDVIFVGENARGDDVRVHYFPGVLAPGPDQGSA